MIRVTDQISIAPGDLSESFDRACGPGSIASLRIGYRLEMAVWLALSGWRGLPPDVNEE